MTCATLNMAKTRHQITEDEGVVYAVYLDPLGYPTFGIGHLITKDDPEYGFAVGTPISKERVEEAFDNDIAIALYDLERLFGLDGWESLPGEVKSILVNMCFNLGLTRLSGFKKTIAAIKDKDYKKAAEEMRDSRWYDQVTNRAERLALRMELLHE